MFDKLAEAVNSDHNLVLRGKTCSLTLLIEIDNDEYFIDIVSGKIINVVSGQFLMRHWDLAIRASQVTWSKFWQKYPEPGFHDIFAMNRFGHCKIEGNTKVLLSHIRFIKDVVSKPRFLGTGVSSNGKA